MTHGRGRNEEQLDPPAPIREGSEIGEGDGLLQYVEHRDQECVGDGYGGLLCGHARLQLVELVA